jgi:hypothetical protein
MRLVGSHIEQTLRFSKATSDIMAGLVGIAMVDFGELQVIADQQQGRGYANDGA